MTIVREPPRDNRGSINSAKSGCLDKSLMWASNLIFPTIPTLRPKSRNVPPGRSTATAFDCKSCDGSAAFAILTLASGHAPNGKPTRIICAMPRASLRSVVDLAVSTACMCRVDTDHGKSASARARNSHCDSGRFQSNSLEVVGGVLQHREQCFMFACNLYFVNDPVCFIHNADAGLLDETTSRAKWSMPRFPSMLEAIPRTSYSPSAKRGTQNLQRSTSWPAHYPIFGPARDSMHCSKIGERVSAGRRL